MANFLVTRNVIVSEVMLVEDVEDEDEARDEAWHPRPSNGKVQHQEKIDVYEVLRVEQ